MTQFFDTQFIIAAWRQLLETLPPTAVVFLDNEHPVTVEQVLAALEGKSTDTAVVAIVRGHAVMVVTEAMRIIRGRFSFGLVPHETKR